MTAVPLDQQVTRCRRSRRRLSIWLPLIRTSCRLRDNSLKGGGGRKAGYNEFWGNPVNGVEKGETNNTKETSVTPSSTCSSSQFGNTSWSSWVGHHTAKLSGFVRFHSRWNARWPRLAAAMYVRARRRSRAAAPSHRG